jgi:6-phosphogluconolactonase (cycloisomerase 2 family)
MSKVRVAALAVVVVAALVAVAAGSAAKGDQGGSPVVGHVYVNDNTAGENTVAGFDRHADGTLTAMAGSPFDAGGAGPGHALASQGSLELSADGRYLLAVDAGSNEVSVLRIKPDGSLQQAGDPVSSGGVNPVSIAVSGSLVYVANAGPGVAVGDTNVTGFTLNAGGHLRPLAGSTVPLDSNSQPGDVLFNGDGSRLVVALVNSSQIASYVVGASGLLTAAPGSPFTAQGVGPFGSEFRPTDPTQLFVSNAHNGAGAGTVSAFTDGPAGVLSSIGSSPFADLQTAPCWVELSADGGSLFAVNTGAGTISSFSIASDGSLTLLGSTPLAQGVGASAEDARLAPDGATLWVVEAARNSVAGLTVAGGSLAEIPGSPTAGPTGATPSGIVVT